MFNGNHFSVAHLQDKDTCGHAEEAVKKRQAMREETCIWQAGIAFLNALVQELDAVLHLQSPLQHWAPNLIHD